MCLFSFSFIYFIWGVNYVVNCFLDSEPFVLSFVFSMCLVDCTYVLTWWLYASSPVCLGRMVLTFRRTSRVYCLVSLSVVCETCFNVMFTFECVFCLRCILTYRLLCLKKTGYLSLLAVTFFTKEKSLTVPRLSLCLEMKAKCNNALN